MSLLAGISQASQCKVIINTANPSPNNFIIYLFLLYAGRGYNLMVYRIIWADGVAPGGAKPAIGYKELAIVIMKKTCKKNTNRKQLSKANPIEGSHIIKK